MPILMILVVSLKEAPCGVPGKLSRTVMLVGEGPP